MLLPRDGRARLEEKLFLIIQQLSLPQKKHRIPREDQMIKIFLFLFASNLNQKEVIPNVEVAYLEFDAIYLPPNFSGPIVAIPVDEPCFEE